MAQKCCEALFLVAVSPPFFFFIIIITAVNAKFMGLSINVKIKQFRINKYFAF